MQLLLKGGSTGTHPVTTAAVVYPITTPIYALGVQDIGAVVEIPPGMSNNLEAKLAYRFFSSDDSQSAGAWSTLTGAVTGPGKSFIAGAPSGGGVFIQLGIQLVMSSGSSTGRASLKHAIAVSK